MKKIIISIFIAALVFNLVGCSKADDKITELEKKTEELENVISSTPTNEITDIITEQPTNTISTIEPTTQEITNTPGSTLEPTKDPIPKPTSEPVNQSVKKGDIITLGSYEQDGNPFNGPEPIEWIVLSASSTEVMLLSKYILEVLPFNEIPSAYLRGGYKNYDITWADSTLRQWLNNEFYNSVFNEKEMDSIKTTYLETDNNPDTGTYGGEKTYDNVFVLSLSEITNPEYGFDPDRKAENVESRMCEITEYAKKFNGILGVLNKYAEWHITKADDDFEDEAEDVERYYMDKDKNTCSYWLRTPSEDGQDVSCVCEDGFINSYKDTPQTHFMGIRPAIVIDTNYLSNKSNVTGKKYIPDDGIEIDEINFPDDNFRGYIKYLDLDENGKLSETERNIKKLRLYYDLDIKDLKGIEFFTSLTALDCISNQLTSLDVSNNTALTHLDCMDNQLTSLDVSNNTALTHLSCWGNQLTSLDVSNCNPNIEIFADSDVKIIKSINQSMEEDNIEIDSINFPDDNFRNYIKTYLDLDENGKLSETERNLEELTLYKKDIKNLKGIEFFTALTSLDCDYNQLTSLDVSKNMALTYLSCVANELTNLDVSKNTALTDLNCDDNQLTSLYLANNTGLTDLNCGHNQLTSLDLSKNTLLTDLDCQDNHQLTSLDLSKNTALSRLNCEGIQLTSLDLCKNTALTFLNCGNNQLTNLDVSNNTTLTKLGCYRNQLTELNVTNNTALSELSCWDNQLTSLDVSNCDPDISIVADSDVNIIK